ncbi:MAG: S8 family serine peptidase [Proteobacteria bacterium]|nr:S8 family serine peptidase [Pseudomonadota bacterium]
MRAIVLALCSLWVTGVVYAQLPLPSVRLPVPQLPLDAATQLPSPAAQLRLPDLRASRAARIRELLRTHREAVDTDRHGNPIVRGEVLLVDPDAATLAAATTRGLTVAQDSRLGSLGLRLVLLRGPAAAVRSLAAVRAVTPGTVADFNHIYLPAGSAVGGPDVRDATSGTPGGAHVSGMRVSGAAAAAVHVTAPDAATARVGLIDGEVDATHEVFNGVELHRHGCAGQAAADPHATAVASLLVGRSASLHGAAAGAGLYAADVYCGAPQGGSVSAVAEAFAWLAQQRVPVINVSLVGPPNNVLEMVVRRMISQGFLVVAAVGNDGPAAPPLYPAAWPGVIGVTAVDERRRVLPEAARGPQVMFAAPGARLAAALPAGGYTLVRGTSFAAPLVAGLLAVHMEVPDPLRAGQALDGLIHEAVRLGAAGRDPVYGYGLVGESLRRQPALGGMHAD